MVAKKRDLDCVRERIPTGLRTQLAQNRQRRLGNLPRLNQSGQFEGQIWPNDSI